MITADDLVDAVDGYTGLVAFDLPLVVRPGRHGLDLRLTARYGGPIWKPATTWNLDAPTSVLGLGWTLVLPRVTARPSHHSSAVAPDTLTYALDLGTGEKRLICTAQTATVWNFATAEGDQWLISYNLSAETWTVVVEDGTTYLLGGAGAGVDAVEWAVAWDGWRGASANVTGQSRYASGWLVQTVTDRFGDQITYAYDAVEVAVGTTNGLAFTQSVVLTSAVAADGSQVALTYQPKSTSEYQNPHTAPSPPNAYQDPIATVYLASLAVSSAAGTALGTVTFGYNTPQALGSGAFTKRLLTAVTESTPGGTTPSLGFSYWGQTVSDGVSTTTPFNSANGALYGALNTATLPAGGTVAYTYTQVQNLACAARTITVQAPGTAPSPSSPRFYFDRDYVVATWLGSDNNAYVTAYAWNGRWIASSALAVIPVGSAAGYAAMQTVTASGNFGIWGNNRLYLFSASDTQIGQWNAAPSPGYFSPTFTGSETVQLAMGKGFAGLLGLTSGKLYRYRWTAGAWVSDTMVTLGGNSAALALAANLRTLIAIAAPTATQPTATLYLYRLSALAAWQTSQISSIGLGPLYPASVTIAAGESFIGYQGTLTVGSLSQAAYGAIWWSADLSTAATATWGTFTAASASQLPTLAATDSQVEIGTIVYRFDGVAWNQADLSQSPYSGMTLDSLSIGVDVAARCFANSQGSSFTCDVVAYDPNTAAWTAAENETSTTQPATAAPRGKRRASAFAVTSSTLYYDQPSAVWQSVTMLSGTLAAADLPTLRLLGDRYLVYQTGTGTAGVATTVYLLDDGAVLAGPTTLTGSQVLPAGSGTSVDSQVGEHAFIAYTGSGGSAQYTLYRPANGDFEAQPSTYTVTAVVANSGVTVSATGYALSGQIVYAWQFSSASATCDPDAVSGSFNLSTAYPGTSTVSTAANGWTQYAWYNKLLSTDTPQTPYPTAGNASQYNAVVAGRMYQISRFTQGTATATASNVLAPLVTATALPAGATSAYIREIQRTDTLDGLATTTTLAYRSDTGQLQTRTLSNLTWNAAGNEFITQALTAQYTYAWQQYSAMQGVNLLSPVAQVQESTTSIGLTSGTTLTTVTSNAVTTWQANWGGGGSQWAPYARYAQAATGAATFNAWTPGSATPSGWIKDELIVTRTPYGLPQDSLDVLSRHLVQLYDTDGMYVVASLFNAPDNNHGIADPQAFTWYGFEPYENPGPWAWSGSGGSLANYITNTDSHTGTQCLQVPPMPTNSAGPIATFVPAQQTMMYVFSCWVFVPSSFSPTQGNGTLTITPYNPSTGASVGTAITLTLTPGGNALGAWAYYQQTINLPQLLSSSGLTALGLRITIANANSATALYLDELRFMPVGTGFEATVYNPQSWLVTATVDEAGQATQTAYDQFYRAIVSYGPGPNVNWTRVYGYSRSISSSSSFSAETPNTALTLTSGAASRYYDFRSANLTNWSVSPTTAWAPANGVLTYTPPSTPPTGVLGATACPPGSPDSSTPQNPPYRFALRATVSNVAATVQVLLGDGVCFLRWNPSIPGYDLVTYNGTQLTQIAVAPTAIGFQSDLIFSVVDQLVTCYAGGYQLFCLQYTKPTTMPSPYGVPMLAVNGICSFDDVVVMAMPQFDAAFFDGFDRPLQQLGIAGVVPLSSGGPFAGKGVCLAGGAFYDACGRRVTDRLDLDAAVQFYQPGGNVNLLDGNPTKSLTDPEGDTLSLTTYLGGQSGGYTYTQYNYQASPLGRLSMAILPREAAAAQSSTQVSWSYGSQLGLLTTPPGGTSATPPGITTNSFWTRIEQQPFFVSGTSTQTVLVETLTERTGRTLQTCRTSPDGTKLYSGYAYDPAGRLSQIQAPNAFSPPASSTAATWIESRAYTFLGLLQSRTTSDTGTTNYIYDNAGRLRFTIDANGASTSPWTVRFTIYDMLDRPLQTGIITSSSYTTLAALQAKANTQVFPIVDPAQSTNPNYAQGSWLQQTSYDVGASLTAPYLLGRAYLIQINQNNSTAYDTETYAYDARGNVLSKSVVMAAISTTTSYTTSFTYDYLDRTAQILYPALDANNPTLAITYDTNGRTAGLGQPAPSSGIVDPSNPPPSLSIAYAGYSYDYFGRVTQVALNNLSTNNIVQRNYSYEVNGWPTALTDNYFSQTMSYAGTYGGNTGTYLTGQIGGLQTAYTPTAYWTQAPANYNQGFTYNGAGQLTSASASNYDAWSVNVPSSNGFDANGNLQQIAVGQTTNSFSYIPSGQTVPQNNQVAKVSGAVSQSLNFTSPTPPTGWWWGSSNGGPSLTQTTTTQHPTGATASLALAGGGVGHDEIFALSTYLPPTGSLTLSAQILANYTPAQNTGILSWFATLYDATGAVASVPIGTITTGSSWQAFSQVVNLGQMAQTYQIGTPIVAVSLELRNGLRTTTGGVGPTVYVGLVSLVLTTPSSPPSSSYAYDDAGDVTSAGENNLSALTYDSVIGLTRTITVTGPQAGQLAFSYGSDNRRTLKTITASGSTTKTMTITGLDGLPLADLVATGSTSTARYYVQGPTGMAAYIQGGTAYYLLNDRQGSTRLVVQGGTLEQDDAAVLATYDYLPFGGLARATGASAATFLYTGQRLDAEAALDDFVARFYDPWLMRFYQADPGQQYPSPYLYCGGDPINLIDPDGAAAVPQPDMNDEPYMWYIRVDGDFIPVWGAPGETPPKDPAASKRTREYKPKGLAEGMREKDTELARALGISLDEFWTKNKHEQFRYPTADTSVTNGEYIYVVKPDNQLVIAPQQLAGRVGNVATYLRHSQLADGGDVFVSGGMYFSDGVVIITDESGHYRPSFGRTLHAAAVLARMGYTQVYIAHFPEFNDDARRKFLHDKQSDPSLKKWMQRPPV